MRLSNYIAQTTEGFVSPLRLIYSLRRLSMREVEKSDPYLARSIMVYMRDCAYNTSEFDEKTFNSQPGAITYSLQLPTTGLTVYFNQSYPKGIGVTCEDARTSINDDIIKYLEAPAPISGGNPYNLTRAELVVNSAMGQNPSNVSGMLEPWRIDDYDQAFQSIFAWVGANSEQFMADTLWGNMATNALRCGNAGSNYDFYACNIQLTQALEQAKQDASGEATMFQKIMVPTMNIFMFMFFAFAPIMAMVMAVTGFHGIKVATSYLLFGIWTQTWLPVAAIINFFIQVQVRSDVHSIISGGSYNLTTLPNIYDILSTKLMVASNLLASVPVVTLALLSGSIFAMTHVARDASARGGKYLDETIGAPSHLKVNPHTTLGGGHVETQGIGYTGLASRSGLGTSLSQGATGAAMRVNYSVAASSASNALHSLAQEKSANLAASATQTASDILGQVNSVRTDQGVSSEESRALQHITDTVQRHMSDAGFKGQVSETDALQIASAAQVGVGGGLGALVKGIVGAKADLTDAERASFARALDKVLSTSDSNSLVKGIGDSQSDSSKVASSWNRLVSSNSSAARNWQKALSDSKSLSDIKKESDSLSQRSDYVQKSGVSLNLDPLKWANVIHNREGGIIQLNDHMDDIDRIMTRNLSPEGVAAYNQLVHQRKDFLQRAGAHSTPAGFAARTDAALLLPQHLAGRDRAQAMIAGEKAISEVFGFGQSMTAAQNAASQIGAAGMMTGEVRSGLGNMTKELGGVRQDINRTGIELDSTVTGNLVNADTDNQPVFNDRKDQLDARFSANSTQNEAGFDRNDDLGRSYEEARQNTQGVLDKNPFHQHLGQAHENLVNTNIAWEATKDATKELWVDTPWIGGGGMLGAGGQELAGEAVETIGTGIRTLGKVAKINPVEEAGRALQSKGASISDEGVRIGNRVVDGLRSKYSTIANRDYGLQGAEQEYFVHKMLSQTHTASNVAEKMNTFFGLVDNPITFGLPRERQEAINQMVSNEIFRANNPINHRMEGPTTQSSSVVSTLLNQAADKHGVPRALVHAVANTESHLDPAATSPKGAQGVMQLMPDTAKGLKVDPSDLAQNIDGGVRYLKQQLAQFDGDIPKAVAAYNAGPDAVRKYGGVPPYKETQDYVAKIQAKLAELREQTQGAQGHMMPTEESNSPQSGQGIIHPQPTQKNEPGRVESRAAAKTDSAVHTPQRNQNTGIQNDHQIPTQTVTHPSEPAQPAAMAHTTGRTAKARKSGKPDVKLPVQSSEPSGEIQGFSVRHPIPSVSGVGFAVSGAKDAITSPQGDEFAQDKSIFVTQHAGQLETASATDMKTDQMGQSSSEIMTAAMAAPFNVTNDRERSFDANTIADEHGYQQDDEQTSGRDSSIPVENMFTQNRVNPHPHFADAEPANTKVGETANQGEASPDQSFVDKVADQEQFRDTPQLSETEARVQAEIDEMLSVPMDATAVMEGQEVEPASPEPTPSQNQYSQVTDTTGCRGTEGYPHQMLSGSTPVMADTPDFYSPADTPGEVLGDGVNADKSEVPSTNHTANDTTMGFPTKKLHTVRE